jgi:HTH-type transcriptional regulator, sugar sensing transcriptional regulator
METRILKEIGLTESEIKVYLALLRIGPAKAGEVIDKSNLQNPVVHRAFHSLIEKGIVNYSIEGKIKHYQAIDPGLLLNLLEEKKSRLKELIPELKKLNEIKKEKTRANVHQGARGVRELLNYLLSNCDKEFLSYGAPGKSLEILGDFFWEAFHKKRVEKKVIAKMIFHKSLKQRANKLNKLPMTKVRTTDKDFEESVETIIAKNKVAIIIYLNNPIGIIIEEELAAKSYRKFFDLLWKISS